MDPWLHIPKDRKRLPVGRLCVIMGLTLLLLLSAFARAGRAADFASSAVVVV